MKLNNNNNLCWTLLQVRLRRNPKKVFKVKLEEEEEEQPFMPESARCLFSDHPGVADFNPVIDELFEQAELLFGSWDELSERGEVNREVKNCRED